jgi:hypothetical protein
MREGIKKKKSSQGVDQKISQKKRKKRKRVRIYHRDDKKTRASSTRERMIHRFFLKCGTQRQRSSLALDPVHSSHIATCAPVSALFDPIA